jgi:hypothetical protein
MPYGTVNTDKLQGTLGGTISPDSSVFRNRIINGAMVVAQRGTSAITVNNAEQFPVDRTNVRCGASGLSATAQQSSIAPSIFRNSIFINVTTGAASGSIDRGYLLQKVEGVNVADFMLGTSAAVTFTLSFWVRSSLTGTFSGSLQNDSQNRSYVFTYTINAANTWEQKIITVAGDTTGTWATDNTSGIFVLLDLGNGSSLRSGTTNSWINGDFRGFTSAVSLFANSSATFYLAGVQLEVGSTASSFEYRSYGQELALCQRYFYRVNDTNWGDQNIGSSYNATRFFIKIPFKVSMRASPTFTASTWDGIMYQNDTAFSVNTISNNYPRTDSTGLDILTSGATGGRAGHFDMVSGNWDFSAEL